MTDDQKKQIMLITVRLTQLGHDVSWVPPISEGPLITTYRFTPKLTSKISQISALSEDLALSLGVETTDIRRLPGEAVIGISVPNKVRRVPLWRDNLGALPLRPTSWKVPLLLGVDSGGTRVIEDLADLPHLLIAGSTGSGKSVLERSLTASLSYWCKPDRIQMVISDTKQVEFGIFDGDPHLWRPRCTTTMQTIQCMDELIAEGEFRLTTLARLGLQNVHSPMCRFPYIVLIIDELSDFMGKSADKEVAKLATSKLGLIVQRARAAGIYVIAATQRPSVDVVTGAVKSNFPARLSFRLPTEADSRTVLGHSGAEHLLALGDCYYISPLRPSYQRLHSCYATQDDITQCIKFASLQPQLTNTYTGATQ